MCLAALGTDTGGSVRVPSALCGLTGLRPGKGRISTRGVIPMSWTLDSVGPMAHTAYDIALLLDALDNQPLSPAHCVAHTSEPGRLRIGIPEDDFFWRESDVQVISAVRNAANTLADIGMQQVQIHLPMVQEVLRAASVISLSDSAAYHQERLESAPEKFGDDVRTRLEWGLKRTGVEYAQARQTGREWRAALRTLFRDQIDLILLPTTPVPAHLIAGSEGLTAAREMLRFTYPFSLSAMPSLSAPCGFTEDGLPIGMQLVAPSEALLVQVAHAYQQVSTWHTRRPEL
jgi:aspartyl-tRNA(Asn)/glutamyl-tRNA(Gln) amidotransferase subunit A